jgi:hypothetical protein
MRTYEELRAEVYDVDDADRLVQLRIEEGEMEKRMTKAVVQDYETIRRSGICNMFDITYVAQAATMMGFKELAKVAKDRAAYSYLLQNFGWLIAQYEIKQ